MTDAEIAAMRSTELERRSPQARHDMTAGRPGARMGWIPGTQAHVPPEYPVRYADVPQFVDQPPHYPHGSDGQDVTIQVRLGSSGQAYAVPVRPPHGGGEQQYYASPYQPRSEMPTEQTWRGAPIVPRDSDYAPNPGTIPIHPRVALRQGTPEPENSGPNRLRLLLDKLDTTQKKVVAAAGVLALASVVAIGANTIGDDAPEKSTSASEQAESKTDAEVAELANGEFELRTYEIPKVAQTKGEITASTMWNLTEEPFDGAKAIGVPANDPSLDITVSPTMEWSVEVPYSEEAEKTAFVETTDEGSTHRKIEIDLADVRLKVAIVPDSLSDTTEIPFFSASPFDITTALTDPNLPLTPEQRASAKTIYEEEWIHAETQAAGLVAAAALADPDQMKFILETSKAKILKAMGIDDPSQFSVSFINPDKFATQPTAPNENFPDIEKLFPNQTVAGMMIANKLETKTVRVVNAEDRRPLFTQLATEPIESE